jgi:hypothetical protein
MMIISALFTIQHAQQLRSIMPQCGITLPPVVAQNRFRRILGMQLGPAGDETIHRDMSIHSFAFAEHVFLRTEKHALV